MTLSDAIRAIQDLHGRPLDPRQERRLGDAIRTVLAELDRPIGAEAHRMSGGRDKSLADDLVHCGRTAAYAVIVGDKGGGLDPERPPWPFLYHPVRKAMMLYIRRLVGYSDGAMKAYPHIKKAREQLTGELGPEGPAGGPTLDEIAERASQLWGRRVPVHYVEPVVTGGLTLKDYVGDEGTTELADSEGGPPVDDPLAPVFGAIPDLAATYIMLVALHNESGLEWAEIGAALDAAPGPPLDGRWPEIHRAALGGHAAFPSDWAGAHAVLAEPPPGSHSAAALKKFKSRTEGKLTAALAAPTNAAA